MLKRGPWPVILQIVPELSAGGAERTTIEVAEAITRAGGRALVLSEGGRLEPELSAAGGELIRFPARTKNPGAVLLNALRIGRIAAEHGVSLIHARSRAPAWSAYLAARRTRRPFVTTYHGIYNQTGRVKGFYNSVMARGDVVICNSHYTASVVRERHSETAHRLVVIHRAVDIERFDPAAVTQERVAAMRSAWGVPPGARVVLQAARLTRWKGQQTLIEAVGLLTAGDEGRDAVFVLAGDDQGRTPYRQELEDMIRGLGLEGKVVIAGHCEDMPAAFKAAFLTVIPSIEAEAFGRVSVEAQAMGCPVLASHIGALPETVAQAIAGFEHEERVGAAPPRTATMPRPEQWLFEPGNALALRDALSNALALSEEQLCSIRARVMDRTRSRFSKQILQAQTLSVYDRLLGTQLAEAFRNAISG